MRVSRQIIRKIKNGQRRKDGSGYHFMRLGDYYDTVAWEGLRTQALRRDNGVCTECGTSMNLQVHHIRYPQSFFIGRDKYINVDADTLDNVVALCEQHHSEKHPHMKPREESEGKPAFIYNEEVPVADIDYRGLNFEREDSSFPYEDDYEPDDPESDSECWS